MKKILLLFIPLIFFFGCEVLSDDDESSTSDSGYSCNAISGCVADNDSPSYTTLSDCENNCQDAYIIGEFCFEIDVNSEIEAVYSFIPTYQDFYLTGASTSSTIETSCYTLWNWENWDDDFDYSLEMANMDSDVNGCSDIQIRVYQDGNLIDTQNILLGCIDGASVGSFSGNMSCDTYCSIYGNTFEGEANIQ